MDSAELTEWFAYMQIEPFGPRQDDTRAGVVAATFANVHRGEEVPPYLPQDFMPSLREIKPAEPKAPIKKLTPAQEAAYLDAVFFGVAPA